MSAKNLSAADTEIAEETSISPIITHWRQIAGSAWYVALLTFVSFFAALFGSLYEQDIKSVFPFVVGCCAFNKAAVGFWLLAFVAAAMFWSAQAEANRSRKEAEDHLINRTKQLERLLQTLPPADFLAGYADIELRCHRAFTDAIEDLEASSDQDALFGVIRFLLFSIANLVRNFEGSPSGTTYAANIMVFRPISELTESQLQEIGPRVQFVTAETDLTALRGVLELQSELSTSTLYDQAVPDEHVAPLALPVPHSCRTPDGKRWRVLPGAPLAFCEGKVSGYTDTKELSDWCRTEGDFPPSVADAIETYFGGDPSRYIRSFVSAPLSPASGATALGVLNIHSSRTDLLSGKEPAKHLWPLLEPIRAMLLDLLLLVEKVEKSDAKPGARPGQTSAVSHSLESRNDPLLEKTNGSD